LCHAGWNHDSSGVSKNIYAIVCACGRSHHPRKIVQSMACKASLTIQLNHHPRCHHNTPKLHRTCIVSRCSRRLIMISYAAAKHAVHVCSLLPIIDVAQLAVHSTSSVEAPVSGSDHISPSRRLSIEADRTEESSGAHLFAIPQACQACHLRFSLGRSLALTSSTR